MNRGDPIVEVVDDLDRIAAAEVDLAGVDRHPDVARIGQLHQAADLFWSLDRSPDVWMWCEPNPEVGRPATDLVAGRRNRVQILVARRLTLLAPTAHVGLEVPAAEYRQK